MATAVAIKNECPYCNGKNDKPFYKGDFGVVLTLIMPDRAMEIDYEEGVYWTEPGAVNYCPMCGRRLNE